MKCPSVFFAGINGIKLPAAPAPGLPMGGYLRITTDRPYISRTIGSYVGSIGSIEADFLKYLASAAVFSRQEVEIDPDQIAESINGLIVRNLAEIKAWMVSLWLTKDNAVDADIGWMAVSIRGKDIINNNQWSSVVSKADGSFDVTTFSKQDLHQVSETPIVSGHWNDGRPLSLDMSLGRDPAVTKLSSKTMRFQRFMYFIDAARSSRDVAIKIAHYCTGLEAMVSSSQTELSHQVAERVSCLLNPLGEQRLATFQLVKSAYTIRSKAVHGSPFKEKEDAHLKDTSTKVDDICRAIARKYISEESFRTAVEADSEKFNTFWLRRTFLEVD